MVQVCTIYFDGACKGNPGSAAGGAVVDYEGVRYEVHGKKFRGTNNEAEYDGVLVGLAKALNLGATRVVVKGDSQLVIRQLEGKYQVRAPNLLPRFTAAKQLLTRFEGVQFDWIKRDANADADAAANRALTS